MKKTVDERVVEMRFDNAQFERNVQTSLSTIDKLKKSLNFSGAAKGLDQINESAKNISFSNMEKSLSAVEKRFSVMGIVGMRVIQNLTDSAMRFVGKINSFVTNGIINGGINRARNLENAQFQLKGLLKDGEAVSAVMKNVNDAVDGTAYSLDAAASIASQLAASGMKAGDQMFSALRGVAGVAAMTNSSYEDIGRIFTQVAGQGRLMGDQLLQLSSRGMNAAATLANYLGVSEAEVRDMTSKGKIDFNTFAAAMDSAFGEHAKKANETFNGAMSNVKASLSRIGALFVTPLIKSNGPLVKFFNALRERINEVKVNIEPFAEKVTNALTKIINAGTKLISKFSIQKLIDKFRGFSKNGPLTSLADKIDKVTKPAKKAAVAVKDFSDVVNKVINGDFGNGQARFDALTKAGYDWAHIQNLVNEKLGDSTRHATNYKESQEALNNTQGITIDQLIKMSDAQLKNLGFTKKEVKAFRELETQSKKTGIPIKELIENTGKLNLKSLVFDSFKNMGTTMVNIFKAIGKAWKETFEPMNANILYNIIAAFHKFSTWIHITDEDADKIKRTFKGLFAILDLVSTVVGGGLKLAFKGLKAILDEFDIDLLDLTSNMGDALVKIRDFLINNKLINGSFELMAKGIKMAAEALHELYIAAKNIPFVQEILKKIKDIDLTKIGEHIINGLKNGLKDGIVSVPKILVEIGKSILDAIKGVLGIHSPSTEMYAIGQFAMEGLVNGLKDGAEKVWKVISGIGSKVLDWFKDFDWNKAFAVGVSIALVGIVKKLINIIDSVTSPLQGLGKVLTSVSGLIDTFSKSLKEVMKSFSKVLNAKAFKMKAEAIRNIAVSIAILAGAIYVLAKIDPKDLWNAVGAIAVLAVVLVALSVAMDKLTDASATIDGRGFNFKGLRTGLIALGLTLLMISATVKIIGKMDPNEMRQGFNGLIGMVMSIAAVFAAFGLFVKGKSAKNIDKAGKMIKKIAVALLLMVLVVKLVGKLSAEEMLKGAAFVYAFVVFVGALAAISSVSKGKLDKLGSMILKISFAMILMVGVVKLAGTLSAEDMFKGIIFAGAFLVFLKALIIVTEVGQENRIKKLGRLLLSVSLAMMLMVGVVKLVGLLSAEDMIKGAAFAFAFIIFIKALVTVTKIGSEEKMAKVAGTIIAMSVAIGILAGVCILLGLIDTSTMAKGLIAVSMLGLILSMMIKSLKGANDVKGSIIAMTVAIGVMAIAVAALSFIDPSKLAGAVIALSILMGMFALIAKASSHLYSSMGSLIVMTVAIGMLAGVILILSALKISKTIEIAASLSLLMLSMAAAMKVVSISGSAAMAAMPAMLAMSAVLAIVAIILGVLAKLNIGPTLEIVKSLSLLMISLSTACLIFAAASAVASLAASGLVPMLALIVGIGALMAAIGGLVKMVPNLETFLSKALPILKLIGQGIGEFLGGIITGIGNAVLDLLPKLGESLSAFMVGVQPFIKLAKNVDSSVLKGVGYISGAIIALSAANFISQVSQLLSFGQTFAELGTQLSSFMMNALPFFMAIQNVDPASVEAANTVAKVVLTLTKADLLSGISNFVSKLTGSSGFEKFGTQLSAFGEAVADFSKKVSGKIDVESVEAAADAGQAMSKLAAAIPKSGGFLQDIIGESDLEKFGSMCKVFGIAIKEMSDSLTGYGGSAINEDAIDSAVRAGKGMSKIANAIPKSEGFLQDIIGESDLEKFGSMCKAFGEAIRGMSDSLTGDFGSSDINDDAISSAVKAGKGMAKVANAIPKKDGFLQGIVGESDLANFGSACQSFGEAIRVMSTALTDDYGNVAINEEAINSAVRAGRAMTQVAEAIPKKHWLDGKVSLDEFGSNISKFGDGISGYSEKVSDINFETMTSSITVANSLVQLTKKLVELDTSGIINFSSIKTIGSAMKEYSDRIADIDSEKINTSITSANRLIRLMSSITNINVSGLTAFGRISSIGSAIKEYSNKVMSIDPIVISASITSAERLARFVNSLTSLNVSGISSFKEAVNSFAETNVGGLEKAFNDATPKAMAAGANLMKALVNGFRTKQSELAASAVIAIGNALRGIAVKAPAFIIAGSSLMNHLVLGIKTNSVNVSRAMTSAVSSTVDNVRNYYNSFYYAGSYLVDGFNAGINANTFKAKATARVMAQAALDAAKEVLKIHSPSKEFYKVGDFAGQGFVNALSDSVDPSYKAGSVIGSSAKKGLCNAISKINDVINGKIDTQPTIRPVLDLSDVKAGASVVGSLFDDETSIGVSAKVNAVSSLMNSRSQNGANDDVVSAINKLRTSINSLSGPSYTINGITYDDGSNISEAVETLVRAVRIGRRV